MIYLAWQMFLWLVAALAVGVWVGRHLQDRRVQALKRDMHRLQGELENARIQLHRNLPLTPPGPRRNAAAPATDDDLKMIHGIGPRIEAILRNQGITRFAQIARLSTEEATALGESLGAFADRIDREDWRGQARALHRTHHGEELP